VCYSFYQNFIYFTVVSEMHYYILQNMVGRMIFDGHWIIFGREGNFENRMIFFLFFPSIDMCWVRNQRAVFSKKFRAFRKSRFALSQHWHLAQFAHTKKFAPWHSLKKLASAPEGGVVWLHRLCLRSHGS
jgi:hypothetical protein